ncbi:MAG: hypothetical protein ACR2L8_09560, partial [Solirubrobacteraceae bacterium]
MNGEVGSVPPVTVANPPKAPQVPAARDCRESTEGAAGAGGQRRRGALKDTRGRVEARAAVGAGRER